MAQYQATRVLDDAQTPLFKAACTALCDTLAPYIADCLSQVRHYSGKLSRIIAQLVLMHGGKAYASAVLN